MRTTHCLTIVACVTFAGLLVAGGLVVDARQDVASLVGSAAQCEDDCTDGSETVYECVHYGQSDTCSTTECIENTIYYSYCTTGETEADCECETDSTGIWVTQVARSQACSTGNPSTWNEHTPGACECKTTYSTRCETGGCSGTITQGPYTRTPREVCMPT